MKREHWAGLIGAGLALLAALGFSSPAAQIKELKSEQEKHSDRLNAHDVHFATQDQQLKDISDGVKELRVWARRHQ